MSSLFAAVLGGHLLAPNAFPSVNRQTLTGHEFFPRLISALFHRGLTVVFLVAAALSVLAAVSSPLRGGHEGATPASARPPAEALS